MSSIKTYKPGEKLIAYLISLGFTQYPGEPGADKDYFANKDGKQVRVNYRKTEISFLNKNGKTLVTHSAITEQEIVEFMEEV